MSFLFDMQSTQIMWPSTYFSYPTPQPAQLSPAASPELEPRVTLGGTSHYETQLEILQVSLLCTQILLQNKWAAHCPHKFWQLAGSQPDQTSVQGSTATPTAALDGTIPLAPTVLSSWAAKPSPAKAEPRPAKAEQPARSRSFWPVLLYHRIAVKCCFVCQHTVLY